MQIQLDTKDLAIICEALAEQMLRQLTYSEYSEYERVKIKESFRLLKSKICQKEVTTYSMVYNETLYILKFEGRYEWELNMASQGSLAENMGDSHLITAGWNVDPDDSVLEWLEEIESNNKTSEPSGSTIYTSMSDLTGVASFFAGSLWQKILWSEDFLGKEPVENLNGLIQRLREKENYKYHFNALSEGLYILQVWAGYDYWELSLSSDKFTPSRFLGNNRDGVNSELPDKIISWINSLSGRQ